MSLMLLPLVAALLLWAMVRRYRADKRALAVGIVAAIGATLGVALAFPEINLNIAYWLLTVWGCVAIVVTIVGLIYAEARLKQVGVQPGR